MRSSFCCGDFLLVTGMEIRKIATIRNEFTDRFGIPRQSGLADAVTSRIVFEKEYRNPDALRGITGFSHLWLLWEFDRIPRDTAFRPMVRPPKLGGNTRVGVFASRSPYRPNPIGLSAVRLLGTEETSEGTVLLVSGADLMNGTPILDIKPYIPYADCIPEAVGGFADAHAEERIPVVIAEEAKAGALSAGKDEAWLARLSEMLSRDPRPAYREDAGRRYGLSFDDTEVEFYAKDDVLTVTEICSKNPQENGK